MELVQIYFKMFNKITIFICLPLSLHFFCCCSSIFPSWIYADAGPPFVGSGWTILMLAALATATKHELSKRKK